MESVSVLSEPLVLDSVALQVTVEPVRLNSHSFGLEAAPCSVDTRAAVFLRPEAMHEGGLVEAVLPSGIQVCVNDHRAVEIALTVPCCSNSDGRATAETTPTTEKTTHVRALRFPVLEGQIRRAASSSTSAGGRVIVPTIGDGVASPTIAGTRRARDETVTGDTVGDAAADEDVDGCGTAWALETGTTVRFIDITSATAQANTVIRDPRDESVSVPTVVNCFYGSSTQQDSAGTTRKPRWKRRRVVVLDAQLMHAPELELVGLVAHTVGRGNNNSTAKS